MKFNRVLPHIVALVLFLIAVFMVFSPQFSGKVMRQGDITSFKASTKEMQDYNKLKQGRANWTNTSFGGMPTYQMATVKTGNKLTTLQKPLSGFLPRPAGYFFLGMLCCYLFLILAGANPWMSLVAAIATGISTTLIVVYAAGHTSKTMTIFYLPLIAAGTLVAFQKRYLLGGLIFGLGMGLAIMANHPQMLFYFGLTFPILGIAKLVEAVKDGELAHFGKAMGALFVGLLLAIGAGASNLLTTLDYTPASMRGGQVLETPLADETSTSADGSVPDNGLSWDYAMLWSNNTKDLVATYAPLAAGGGGGQPFDDNSFANAFQKAGFQAPAANRVPAYHGGKIEGTAGPEYLGAVVWALFIFGLFTARRSTAIWLGAGAVLVMIVSLGKYAPNFNQLLFDLIPLLNKFRAPSSALNILPFMMASLGILGASRWLETNKENPEKARKQLLYSGIAAAAFGLFVLFVLPSILGFSTVTDDRLSQSIQNSLTQAGQSAAQAKQVVNNILDGLEASRKSLYMGDAWRSFLFVGLTFAALFSIWKKWVTPMIGGLILIGLVAFDFSGINKRYMGDANWQKPQRVFQLPESPADQQIKQDKDLQYRVFNLAGNPWSDPTTSYHHKSVGGYSAVKMRRYQDLITSSLGGTNPSAADPDVLDMLNTKYIIRSPQQAERRPTAYGPAWIVSNIQIANSNDAELAALKTVNNLKATAIVHEEFSAEINGLQPNGQGTIQLTNHGPMEARYSFNSPAEQLVVFSEVWYGPDKGWEVTIDGKPADLIRANYVLRALRVPAGQHEIVMTFDPSSFAVGKTISLLSSLMLILGTLAYAFYFGYWKPRKTATA